MSGWIKLHRSIKDWEWYDDLNVRLTFLHCLVEANFKDKSFKGTLFPRGSFPCGRDQLAKDIGITTQQLRTAFNKLKSTGEITTRTTSKGTSVTVCNYDSYQELQPADNQQSNQQVTNNQPASNHSIRREELKKVRTPPSTKPKLDVSELDNIDPRAKQSILEWIEYKTSIKKPMKQPALKKLLKSSPQAIIAAVDASIMNGYQGLFPEKYESKQQQYTAPSRDLTKPTMS